MSQVFALIGPRCAVRLALASLTAALLAGCADSSRFLGDPLGNPFKSASTDPTPTASIDMPPPSYTPRAPAVSSQPLPAPSTYASPVHPSPRLAQTYAAPQPERTATVGAATGHGSWSAQGGMSIIAANGETVTVLAERYNVPTDALLRVNGFSSAGQVRAGTRLVIPVYSASRVTTTRIVRTETETKIEHKTKDHSSREKLLAKHESEPSHDKVATKRETEASREKVATKHDSDSAREKLHWVKGPQPAKIADDEKKGRGHDKKADKSADAAATHGSKKGSKSDADKPSMKTAQLEEPTRKSSVDTTPTASLPPADEKPSAGANPEFRWPAHGRIIQGFKSGGNDGINIAVPEGTAVKAAENGVVAYAGNEIKGFGNLVLIRHPNGYVSAYANNGDIEVHRGEQVKRGQVIAKSGQSGNVASPQLHFELRKGSTPVDPTHYLAGT